MFPLRLVCFLLVTIVGTKGEYCHSKDDNPYMMFSTKTPYDIVRGSGGSETTCRPVQIWLMSRHGTRHAEDDEITSMQEVVKFQKDLIENEKAGLLPEFGGLCPQDLEALKKWRWHDTAQNQSGFLTDQGRNELYALATRYKIRYPSLLKGPYTPKDFYFRHSNIQRTNQSCRAFIDGLFGDGVNETVDIIFKESDIILKPFEICQYWIDNIYNDTNYYEEEQPAFRKTAEYQNVRIVNSQFTEAPGEPKLLASVSEKLGYNYVLKHNDIMAMYGNCRFDKSEYLDNVSPWCSVFTKRQLLLLEYHEDIGRYYKYSYGHEVNAKLGRLPLRHLIEVFEKTVRNDGVPVGPKLLAMFTHDTMFDMLFSALNFAKEQMQLSGTDYEDFLVIRKYRTSVNIPFSANIAAVLHDCGPCDERFKVQFFLNEKQMDLPGCERGLCDWLFLKRQYSDYKSWNLDFCTQESTSVQQ